MGPEWRFGVEADEIRQIDFLLDQLARAVESGEVPLESYNAMAPRYLARREQLVAAITASASAAGNAARAGSEQRQTTVGPPTSAVAARRVSKPVEWTTVLTFLGAFLVVVAAAIFAIVVWDVIGVVGKLAFMGAMTALFYFAGWRADRMHLAAGATALTVVGSAMLLFEGWIAIDGYGLSGPLPWSAVLLVCSVVYWFTEVRLANRFFGVIGSAAQIGWWWLLGEGMGLTVPVRLAGVAVIAALWLVAAERGRENPTVGSLARALEWAAPVVQVLVAVGLLANMAWLGSTDTRALVAAAIAAAAGGVTVGRSRLVTPTTRLWFAAALQAPLFAFAWAAWGSAGPGWIAVGVLVAAAIAYEWVAVTRAGLSFAIVGLLAETTALALACAALQVDDHVAVLLFAALAAVWAAAARLARSEDLGTGYPHLGEVSVAAEVGSALVLLGASLAVPFVAVDAPLVGTVLPRIDALTALGVLAAWYASATVAHHRGGHLALAGSAWAFYALGAVLSWALPDRSADLYGTALVALACVWLLSADALTQTYGELWRVVTRAAARAAMVLIALGSFAVIAVTSEQEVTYWMSALLGGAAVALALDAVRSGSRISAALSTGFVSASAAAGASVYARAAGWESPGAWASPAAAWMGVATSAVVAWRARSRRFDAAVSVGAAATGTMAAALSSGYPVWAAWALAGSTVAWALAAWRTDQLLTLAAGSTAFAAACALLAEFAVSGSVTVIALGAAGLVLGAPAFTRVAGPGGRYARAGAGVAIAGLIGLAAVPCLGMAAELLGSGDSWYRIGEFGIALSLAILAAGVIAQSVRWRVEPGYYAGGLVLVVAMWAWLGAADATWVELYSTPLALYLVAAGYVRVRLNPEHGFPVATDIGAVGIGLGLPLITALTVPASDAPIHAAWVLGLSLAAIGGGVAAKSRWYFFGGVAASAAVALYRSFTVLAEFWWLVLGLVGVAMLVIALTWERQRMMVADTRARLSRSFEQWR